MRHPFELDPEIIHHIIYSQAGSVAKALIELIMNSVDAGAGAITLNITPGGFSCCDDGRGFTSYDDVKRYFGRFGTPHREGDATYGRFRLGRGQIMAHARTVWRSQRWQMEVDTRVMGYEYELTEPEALQAGCTISGDWYSRFPVRSGCPVFRKYVTRSVTRQSR
nr:ATP-binding protein [Pantoea deleyi]